MIEGRREGMNNNNNNTNSGVTVVGSDAPSDYHISPRTTTEPPPPTTVSSSSAPPPPPPPPQSITSQMAAAAASPPYTAAPPPAGVTPLTEKKKRGRPRKYAPDGSVRKALSPKPISTAAPPVIDFSTGKRAKIKPQSAGKIHHHHQQPPPPPPAQPQPQPKEMEALGDWVSCSVGANFMPHIINVNTGEDVTMKVISFSQQGPRAICILSANGVISSVTLRQPDSSGGTLTYEGRFEILSLAGSFIPSESGGIRNRSGGMSVSLSSPDGRVVGGSVAGLLVAASPVQIVVGSFFTGVQQVQHDQKTAKKQKPEHITITVPTTAAVPVAVPVPAPAAANEQPYSAAAKQNPSSFRGDNWSSFSSPESRNKATDINVSLQ